MGKAVEEVLTNLSNSSLIKNNYTILYGFPRPSGANGHSKEIFQENKNNLINIIKNINID